jgi:hypothetical protein
VFSTETKFPIEHATRDKDVASAVIGDNMPLRTMLHSRRELSFRKPETKQAHQSEGTASKRFMGAVDFFLIEVDKVSNARV